MLSQQIELSQSDIRDALDPGTALSKRITPVGAAMETMDAMIDECERALAGADEWIRACSQRLRMAEDALLRAVRGGCRGWEE